MNQLHDLIYVVEYNYHPSQVGRVSFYLKDDADRNHLSGPIDQLAYVAEHMFAPCRISPEQKTLTDVLKQDVTIFTSGDISYGELSTDIIDGLGARGFRIEKAPPF